MSALAAALGLALTLALASAGAAAEITRIPAVLHVHSELSTGDFSLDDLARMAHEQGIEALLLSENYLLRIEYGLPPFRALTRLVREERSVLDTGLETYLARVADLRRRHPDLVVVAGVEVIPHYHWTGSPLSLALELHDVQKNLLVFGVSDAAALRSLPAVGNRPADRYTWQSALDAAPALLIVPGIGLLFTRRRHRARVGRAVVVLYRRRVAEAAMLLAVGAVALARGWPFTQDLYPPWRDYGVAPAQALIDHVDRLGGVTVWSFPETADSGERALGPVRVTWRTAPHADDLLRTFRYTAFGAVYEQPARLVEPGGGWDMILAQYAARERSRPTWAVGESGFHGFSAGKRVGPVQTVFLASERSEPALLDAFKHGRMYALRRTPEVGLALRDFRVSDGAGSVVSGETLRPAAGAPVEVTVAVDATDGSARPLQVTLLRNGSIVDTWMGNTPLRGTHRERVEGAPAVFRLEARGPAPHRLVSNPIFVLPGPRP